MNKCFFIGKVLNNPEFKFLYMNKKISIAYFYIRLSNGSIIKIFGYDEKADYIFRNIGIGQFLTIEGNIRQRNGLLEIEIERINKMVHFIK